MNFLNVLWIWTLNGNGKKDRFLTKCTANVNFQRFLKILLLMILDAINRISFGNCRRSKGFQVNYRPGQLWKTWFCQYPLKVQICCTFYVEVFLRIHKFNHSMMIQNYWFYLYSHFVNFENMHGYLLYGSLGTDWAIRHAVCVWCRYVGVWMYVSQKMRHNFGSQLHYMVQKTLRTMVQGGWGYCIAEEN